MKIHWLLLLACFIVFFSVPSYSQEKEEINYHKYKNEIGVDVQYLFSSNAIGTNLIYKRRVPETGLIAVNEKKAYRFQLSVRTNTELGQRKIDTLLNTGYNLVNLNDNNYVFLATGVGMERQINRKRFQYSYGLDVGYTYNDSRNIFYHVFNSFPSGKTIALRTAIRTSSHGPSLTPFFGFKFFLVPEISLSIESSLPVAFAFVSRSYTEQELPDEVVLTVRKERIKEISSSFDFLRMLNVSYYF